MLHLSLLFQSRRRDFKEMTMAERSKQNMEVWATSAAAAANAILPPGILGIQKLRFFSGNAIGPSHRSGSLEECALPHTHLVWPKSGGADWVTMCKGKSEICVKVFLVVEHSVCRECLQEHVAEEWSFCLCVIY